MTNFRDTTDETFNADINATEIVIVDVWAEWCGPCKMIMPLIEAAAQQYPNITFLKLNADSTTKMGELQVRGVPTLLKYKNGELVGRNVGSVGKQQLTKFIEA